jgi:hypothetical protein
MIAGLGEIVEQIEEAGKTGWELAETEVLEMAPVVVPNGVLVVNDQFADALHSRCLDLPNGE